MLAVGSCICRLDRVLLNGDLQCGYLYYNVQRMKWKDAILQTSSNYKLKKLNERYSLQVI